MVNLNGVTATFKGAHRHAKHLTGTLNGRIYCPQDVPTAGQTGYTTASTSRTSMHPYPKCLLTHAPNGTRAPNVTAPTAQSLRHNFFAIIILVVTRYTI
ncbi:hypothetical protein PAXRUDRAFT_827035 [Paxillus rubicundulus Ve08.2h10]|uniref:Uncharacterized protein n=1 Tax=Paxillus rubicundulus Ve08.2h10 TaxID=930991 RepID=A0A0D0DDR8_9AGAM|nr:hypothetical protein PAXRUDRAFT_827035 [Paxillus rubicundulus Ve08.2h10]